MARIIRTAAARLYDLAREVCCQQVTGGDDDLVCGLACGLAAWAVSACVSWLSR